MKLSRSIWATHQAKDVFLFSLSNGKTEVVFSNYGCTITAIRLLTDCGLHNIVLGYKSFAEYVNDPYYMGCIVGRFANRISDGSFWIDGRKVQLAMNEVHLNNHVHGGFEGFNRKVFDVTNVEEEPDRIAVRMEYVSVHGEEGYPGELLVAVTYELRSNGEFTMYFEAKADQPTHVNLTSHLYFNISSQNDISDHSLSIESKEYLQSNHRFLPTGKRLAVENSVYDFRTLRKIKTNGWQHEPLYNTYFLFNETSSCIKAVLSGSNGLSLGISTSLPGILLYTGDYLKAPFVKNGGVCLECQYPPDAPNHHHFPSTLLKPGDVYDHFVRYIFSA